MKKILPLLLLLLMALSCNFSDQQSMDSAQKKIVSDHDELEEAKAIARKLMEGLEQVEQKEISREEFESVSKPLQKQLNTLILVLEDKELQELESYRYELMVENVEKKDTESFEM